MLRAEEVFAWVALSRAPALDAQILSKALGSLGDTPGVIERLGRRAPQRRSSAAVARISVERRRSRGRRRARLASAALRIMSCRLPTRAILRLLRELPSRPIALYVAGNVGVLNDPQLAIVGSRNPIPGRPRYRVRIRRIARSVRARPSPADSPTASTAPRIAARSQRRESRWRCSASGIDVIYPRINRTLSEEILQQRRLISEFPLGTPPRRENFPQRNRIIATLSLGTLVVEAARGSAAP